MINLFPSDQIVGVFSGFTEGGLEFHANLVLPYRVDFQNIPMHGQFVLVQLENPDEAVMGRITSFSSDGRLSHGVGEEFNIRAVRENRSIPEDLREQYLKYRVNIRVLGVVRSLGSKLVYVPSHRRLPHVGSPVAFPSSEVLMELAGNNDAGAAIGWYALGEYVYAHKNPAIEAREDFKKCSPEIQIKFPVSNLVSRRTFVFARAGFGKTNLNKLLFSMLYKENPMVEKRGGRQVPVGTVIFDRDGEYFWPDDKGRPGLCDVPELNDKVVVFTSRKAPSSYYQSFVAGGIKLDIRRLRPSDVISIAVSAEKQDQQNIRKLRGMSQNDWTELVNLVDEHGNEAALETVKSLLKLEQGQDAEALAARANMTAIVRSLHDKSSSLLDMVMKALADGKLCIVDVSQMLGGQALILSGLILKRIFDRNQEEFTAAVPKTIPTIAVLEEAQSVLSGSSTAIEPFITWVKEGRKYDLGAMMITQQPGSIPTEILSQGDNWFVFHLLSSVDLNSVKNANAHYSSDILSSILNEPIPGQGVFWSSASGRSYPLSLRVLSFELYAKTQDPDYNKPLLNTYSRSLAEEFLLARVSEQEMDANNEEDQEPVDVMERYLTDAIRHVASNQQFRAQLDSRGVPWGKANTVIAEILPTHIDNRRDLAYQLVPRVLNNIYGSNGWHTFKADSGANWIKSGPKEE